MAHFLWIGTQRVKIISSIMTEYLYIKGIATTYRYVRTYVTGFAKTFPNGHVLPHMRILAHTRMGYPVRVWANIMSHTRMGVPYEYACMILHSYATCTAGINFCHIR